jgi:TRAP-type C4-dicarboxylate transport system permease small subunit
VPQNKAVAALWTSWIGSRKLNTHVSSVFEGVGVVAFLLMMVITTVDVVGAKAFLTPLPGSLDTVMLAQLVAMSFAVAMTLISGRHVAVEFFTPLLPKPMQKLAEVLVNALGLGLFMAHALAYRGLCPPAYAGRGDHPTIRVPLYPFAWGAALACIPVSLVYLHKLIQSLMELFKK